MMRVASTGRWGIFCVLVCCVAATAQQRDTIEAGDLGYVDVHRQPAFSTTTQVDAQGNIEMPFVGEVRIAGLTEQEAAAVVRTALGRYIRNPRVQVARSAMTPETAGFRTPEMQTDCPAEIQQRRVHLRGPSGKLRKGQRQLPRRTNSIIVTDRPETLKNVLNVISQLDDMDSQRTQVRIEAKIAEVQTGALKDLGIRWWVQESQILGGSYPMPNQLTPIGAARGASANPLANEDFYGTLFGSDANNVQGREFINRGDLDRRLNVPTMVPKVGQMFFGLLNDNVDIGALVDALVSDDKAELLANPHTLTVNHRPARIEMVDLFPYTEFGTEVSGRANFSIQFLELGIQLEVTPHVYQDDAGEYVRLELKPEVSFPVGSVNNVPIRSVRSAETEALARNGQTVVVGGIYRNELHNVEQGVPVLRKVPGLGRLFKRVEKSKDQTELMVFVTPTVHETPESVTWDRMINLSSTDLQQAGVLPAVTSEGDTEE